MNKQVQELNRRLTSLLIEGKNYDEVIQVCTEIIALIEQEPRHVASSYYGHRGFAYLEKGDDDLAFADFDEGIKCEPNYGRPYYSRACAYLKRNNYEKAIEDLLPADRYDIFSKTYHPEVYTAARLNVIYDENKEERNKTFKLYFELLKAIALIQRKLFYTSQETEVSHYTSLYTLKSLCNEKSFRFYNARYMNDPEEGRTLFELVENGAELENVLYRENENRLHPSPTYIGSFVTMNSTERETKDTLPLWRTYGRHEGEDAAGVCLIFGYDGKNFDMQNTLRIGDMSQFESDDSRNLQQKSRLPALYRISYKNKNEELSKELGELGQALQNIKQSDEFNGKMHRRALVELAGELLDSIRFLFKATHYKEEQEVRVLQFCYYKDNGAQISHRGIKVDEEQIPPRFYLEAPNRFRFSEVILGPRTRGIREWEQWIKERNENVKVGQSQLKFGNSYY